MRRDGSFDSKLVDGQHDSASDEFAGRRLGADLDEINGEAHVERSKHQAVGRVLKVAQGQVSSVADGEDAGPASSVGSKRVVMMVDHCEGIRELQGIHRQRNLNERCVWLVPSFDTQPFFETKTA